MTEARTSIDQTPTSYPELNQVLVDLTENARDILGDSFVGAYLQGSFAVGDADLQSDCDFLIPVRAPITSEQEVGLRALHDEIPTRPGHWTKHLEGSYPLVAELRSLGGLGREWLYIDHGWREMQWSTHCNTEVVRWSLRECGVTLVGPDPRSFVDQVGAAVLRARMARDVVTFLPDLFTWITFEIAWTQRYAVTTLCRILYTLDAGRVSSKRVALKWGPERLDSQWRGLMRQVLEDRPLGFDPDQQPRPGSVEQTLAFSEYAQQWARWRASQ